MTFNLRSRSGLEQPAFGVKIDANHRRQSGQLRVIFCFTLGVVLDTIVSVLKLA
jgi:hypothetical protein